MRRIQLTDIEYAVRLYNSKTEIGNKEIKQRIRRYLKNILKKAR